MKMKTFYQACFEILCSVNKTHVAGSLTIWKTGRYTKYTINQDGQFCLSFVSHGTSTSGHLWYCSDANYIYVTFPKSGSVV